MNTSLTETSFFQHTTQLNIARAKFCAIIAIIIEIFLLSRNFMVYGFSLHYYVQMYLFLLVISIIVYGALHILQRREDLEAYRSAHRLMFLYYMLTLLWGVTMALIDQNSYGHVTAYLINLLITATFFITSRKTFIFLHIFPVIVLFVGFLLFFPDSPFLVGHTINIAIFFLFVAIGTQIIYKYTKQTFEQGQLLNSQNEELNRLNQYLEHLANKDALTDLYNRHYLNMFIEQEQTRNEVIALWALDIDHFKAYNDHYGHLQGDSVLQQVARTLQEVANKNDLLAVRLGGEEFLVVGFNRPLEQVACIAEELRAAVERLQIEHLHSQTSDVVTVSIGYISASIATFANFNELLETADKALYKSKQNGRNKIFTV